MVKSYEDIQHILNITGLIDNFTKPEIEHFVTLIHEVYFEKDACIIQENEISDLVYIIKEGEAQVKKLDLKTGYTHIIAKLGPGSLLGELSQLDDSPHSASVFAVTPCTVLAF